MPFPFPHPAAVLPLRRYCNRWLNFPALVIGSMVPDAGYFIKGVDNLSHQALGSLVFGVPAGGLLLAVLYSLRSTRPLRPIFSRTSSPIWILVLSLIIGIWTHVLWDSCTHIDGWIVMHSELLQTPIVAFAGHTARLCHLLWYASSFGGAIWLFLAFENWKQNSTSRPGAARRKAILQDAVLIAALVVLVSLVHHLLRNPVGFALTIMLSIVVALQFVFRMQTEPN